MSFKGTFDYTNPTQSAGDFFFGLGGDVSLAVGDVNPDANGNWQSTVSTVAIVTTGDIVNFDSSGMHVDLAGGVSVEFDINGPFSVGELQFVAKNLQLVYQSPDANAAESLVVSGGIALPQLGGAELQLGTDGNSGGLLIDPQTGQWTLDGWRIVLPEIPAGIFMIKSFSLGFNGAGQNSTDSSNWQLAVAGQIKLFAASGLMVGVQLTLGEKADHFIISDIGASIRNMNPGLPIPGLEAFMTDIGFNVDNIPSSITASILLGAAFGEQVTIGSKEYALIQVLLQGQYSAADIKIVGKVLLAGGILGSVDGTLDLDWGAGSYSLDATGTFLYGAIEAHLNLTFTPAADTGLFDAKLQVPSEIPVIGGHSLAEGAVLWNVSHEPGGPRFIAAWGTFLGHWSYGFEYDFTKDQFSLIGSKAIDGLQSEIPSDVGPAPNAYSCAYPTTAPSVSHASGGFLASGGSTDSYGLMNITWNNPASDGQDKILVNAGNTSILVWGPGAPAGWIYDADDDLAFQIVADQSVAGNVLLHVVSINAISGNNTPDNPDLYETLPNIILNVVLTSTNVQTINYDIDWAGSYSSPAPEIDSLGVSQESAVSALGAAGGTDPIVENNATIAFQFRSTDIDTTSVDFYYDYDGQSYDGVRFASLTQTDLTANPPEVSGWAAVSYQWDLSGLAPAETFVYAVIKDAGHAATRTAYFGSVLPTTKVNFSVDFGNASVPATMFPGLSLSVTPVAAYMVSSIVDGTVTISGTPDLQSGGVFWFDGLTATSNVNNGWPYYVTSVDAAAGSFAFAATQGGMPIADANATAGGGNVYAVSGATTYYATNFNGQVFPDLVSGVYRFAMPPSSGAFAPSPGPDQSQSYKNELVEYVTITNGATRVNVDFNFTSQPVIFGVVYNDLIVTGSRDASDPPVAGITVYLDDNDNGVLDPGEPYQVTGADGSYLFLHNFTLDPNDPSSQTYTTHVRQVLPPGWQAQIAPSAPITLTANDDIEALKSYDFLDAQPVTLSGNVFNDAENSGMKNAGDRALANVTLTVTDPAGATHAVVTQEDGSWSYQSMARGDYTVQVNVPTGATLSAPLSVPAPSGSVHYFFLQLSAVTAPFSSVQATSAFNPQTLTYDVWAIGYYPTTTCYDRLDPQEGFVWKHSAMAKNGDVDMVALGQNLIGDWHADGIPTLLSVIGYTKGEPLNMYFADNTPSSIDSPDIAPIGQAPPGNLFALSYDPGNPGYSALVSVDRQGNAWLWSNVAGTSDRTFVQSRMPLFTLPSWTVSKVVGLDLASDQETQPRDLAMGIITAPGALQVTIWNHTTQLLNSYDVSGNQFVAMVAGDYNGDGLQDVAVLTAGNGTDFYFVTVLLTQSDGTSQPVSYAGTGLPRDSAANPAANLAGIRIDGTRQILLWTTSDSTGSYINCAWVGNMNLLTTATASNQAGYVVATSAGDFKSAQAAGFAVVSATPVKRPDFKTITYGGYVTGTLLPIKADTYTVTAETTQYGGIFGGYDFGLNGASQTVSSMTGGIVFADYNSNGLHDPGEPPLAGYVVRVVSPSGAVELTISSDGSDGSAVGSFSFDNVAAGSHLEVALPVSSWLSQNPPPGIVNLATGGNALQTTVEFVGGPSLAAIPTSLLDYYTVARTGDLQGTGRQNLVIRTLDSLFVQVFGSAVNSSFVQLDPGSGGAGNWAPELELADVNGDGKLDIVTAGQSGVAVLLNLGLGEFSAPTVVLGDTLVGSAMYGTAIAIAPGGNSEADQILAATQNTGTVYVIGWNPGTASAVYTGQSFDTGREIHRMAMGDVNGDGAIDLVIWDTGSYSVWSYDSGSGFAKGTELFVPGYFDGTIKVAQLFPGAPSIVFLGRNADVVQLISYRQGTAAQIVTLDAPTGQVEQQSIVVGDFAANGSGATDVAAAVGPYVTILSRGVNPADTANPTGPDPSVPMVVVGEFQYPAYVGALAPAALTPGAGDDLLVIGVDGSVMPYYNVTNNYVIPAAEGGSLYDFAVHLANTGGGTISGRIFYDADSSGAWTPGDYGWSDSVIVYLDLNNNGSLDPMDPRTTPSIDGCFQFALLSPGAYTVRTVVGAGFQLTTPAAQTVSVPDVPGGAAYGADFGVVALSAAADFNGDGKPDLLLTDPATGKVYTQLRNGLGRYTTYQLGVLPGADWVVAGAGDIGGNGSTSVLINNVVTGNLQYWNMRVGRGVPVLNRVVEMKYKVPLGWRVAATGDADGDGKLELLIRQDATGTHRIVRFHGDGSGIETPFLAPPNHSIIGMGDLNGDGVIDLLLRDGRDDGALIARLTEGTGTRDVALDKVPGNWTFAGVVDVNLDGVDDLVFQDRAAGKGFAWALDRGAKIAAIVDLRIGELGRLRLHLAEGSVDRVRSTLS